MKKLSNILLEQCKIDGSLQLTLGQLQSVLKNQGIGFWIILLSFPSALPVPAVGYSVPFGLILIWLSIRLFLGKETSFPQKWENKMLKLSSKTMKFAIKFLQMIEHFFRPQRLKSFNKFFNRKIVAINLLILSSIMTAPIPLTNTAPAMLILLFGFGLLEEDGLALFICQILSVLMISAYTIVAIWICTFGLESFQAFLKWLF